MATVTPTTSAQRSADGSAFEVTWALTSSNADGAPIRIDNDCQITWVARGT